MSGFVILLTLPLAPINTAAWGTPGARSIIISLSPAQTIMVEFPLGFARCVGESAHECSQQRAGAGTYDVSIRADALRHFPRDACSPLVTRLERSEWLVTMMVAAGGGRTDLFRFSNQEGAYSTSVPAPEESRISMRAARRTSAMAGWSPGNLSACANRTEAPSITKVPPGSHASQKVIFQQELGKKCFLSRKKKDRITGCARRDGGRPQGLRRT